MKRKLLAISALCLSLALSPLGVINASAAITTKGIPTATAYEKGSTGELSEEDGKYPIYYVCNLNKFDDEAHFLDSPGGSDLYWISRGEEVQVIENMNNGYYRVIHEKTEGYILATQISREFTDDVCKGEEKILFTVGYMGAKISIYSSPSTSSSEIGKVDKLSILVATGNMKDGFYEVKFDGTTGYVFATNVYAPWDVVTKGTPYVAVNCKSGLNLRPYPNSNNTELITIPMGETMYYLGKIKNDWLLVSYNGYIGWVYCNWVMAASNASGSGSETSSSSATSSESTSSGSESEGPKAEYEVVVPKNWSPLQADTSLTVVNVNTNVTLRKEANGKSDALAYIPLGATCTFKKDMGNGFYQVEYNGQTGYAFNDYLTVTSQQLKVVNVNEYVTLRKEASTSSEKVCEIDLGEIVTFEGAAGSNFYKVSYNGKTGYIPKIYLLWQ